jgi:acetyltransferase-like isoleucine patch superfamily enzyme
MKKNVALALGGAPKVLRLLRRSFGALSSAARLFGYRLMFPGLRVGRKVTIERGVKIDVMNGATLHLGDGTTIEAGCRLWSGGKLSIGANGFVGTCSVIIAVDRIAIGEDALVASHCVIRDHDHGTSGLPYRAQPLVSSPVTMGDNVWLGAGVTVLKGASIGDNAVIGAGAVVTRPIPENSTAVGVPARPVGRHRP